MKIKYTLVFIILTATCMMAQYDYYDNSSVYQMMQTMQTNAAIQNAWNTYNEQVKSRYTKLFNDAYQAGESGNHKEAIRQYNLALIWASTSTAYNNIGYSQSALGEYDEALKSYNKALEIDPDNTSAQNNKDNVLRKISLKDSAPITIYKLLIGNVDKNNKIETNYGERIYSRNSMYLSPKIYYRGVANTKLNLHIKIYNPDGTLSTGSSSSSGYSYDYTLTVSKSGYSTLSCWGSSKKGNWSQGTYRFEVWYNDYCLAHTEVSLSESYSAPAKSYYSGQYAPQAPAYQSGSGSHQMHLVKVNCNYCKGTGVNPIATSTPSYGGKCTGAMFAAVMLQLRTEPI